MFRCFGTNFGIFWMMLDQIIVPDSVINVILLFVLIKMIRNMCVCNLVT